MTEQFAPFEVFGGLRARAKCDTCCEGYCPTDEMTGLETDPLLHIEVDGTRYVSDRYVAILAELVDLTKAAPDAFALFGDRVIAQDSPGLANMVVPDSEPGPSSQPLGPEKVGNLTDAGIDIREGGKGNPQHLYLAGRHVGWLMPMSGPGDPGDNVMTVADIPEVRRLHGETQGRWDEAARLLHVIRRYSERVK